MTWKKTDLNSRDYPSGDIQRVIMDYVITKEAEYDPEDPALYRFPATWDLQLHTYVTLAPEHRQMVADPGQGFLHKVAREANNLVAEGSLVKFKRGADNRYATPGLMDRYQSAMAKEKEAQNLITEAQDRFYKATEEVQRYAGIKPFSVEGYDLLTRVLNRHNESLEFG